jgi:hypothetical protein
MLSPFECAKQGPSLRQIDLLQHDGGNPSGECYFTLTIAGLHPVGPSISPCASKPSGESSSLLPLPLRFFHADNGSQFIKYALKPCCDQQGIEFTRSRTNKKNNPCFVE